MGSQKRLIEGFYGPNRWFSEVCLRVYGAIVAAFEFSIEALTIPAYKAQNTFKKP